MLNRAVRLSFIVGLVLLSCLGLWWLTSDSAAIRFHVSQMGTAREKIAKTGARDPRQSEFIERYDAHRDALVRLGYFERREFVLRSISVPSLESKRLWQELLYRFPDHPHVTMQGYGPAAIDMVVVWDRPNMIARWQEVIGAHDLPPDPVLSKRRMVPENGYVSFVGTWIDDDGNVLYTISDEGDGNLRFHVREFEPWTTSIKNLRAENGTVFFDQYHRPRISEELESPVSVDGEHPFSGMRRLVELSRIEGNERAIRMSMSTIQLEDPTSQVLRRQDELLP